MKSRTQEMWWGTAIEAPDPGALASFYSELLGWPIGHEEPGTAILAAPEGSIFVVFQQATDCEAATTRVGQTWPRVPHRPSPLEHPTQVIHPRWHVRHLRTPALQRSRHGSGRAENFRLARGE